MGHDEICVREKSIATSGFIKKYRKSHTSNLTAYLALEQAKCKQTQEE